MSDDSACYSTCNNIYSSSLDPNRTFCKKGCGSDFEKEECRINTCDKLCVKKEIGDDNNKWGSKINI